MSQRSLKSSVTALLAILLWALAFESAQAAGQWYSYVQIGGKTYGSTLYPTKAQAVAAMATLDPANVDGGEPILREAGISSMSANSVTYIYKAPPSTSFLASGVTPGVVFPWAPANATYGYEYQWASGPPGYQSDVYTFPDEATLVSTYTVSGTCNQSGGESVSHSPTSGWASLPGSTQSPWDQVELRNYTRTAVIWDESLTPPACHTYVSPEYAVRTRMIACVSGYETDGMSSTDGYSTGALYCTDPYTGYVTGPLLECPQNGGPSTSVGDPCDVSTGDLSQPENDFSAAGLSFTRTYHSAVVESTHALGVGWTHNYAGGLALSNGVPTGILKADGHQDAVQLINGAYETLSGTGVHIQASGSNWVASKTDGSSTVYDSNGQLIEQVTAAGLITTLAYSSNAQLGVNQLVSVTGPFGHTLQFAYDTSGRLTTLTEPDNSSVITYGYDTNNNLVSVTYPDTSSRSYQYQNSSFPNNLTGIVDESGTQFLTATYDPTTGAVTSSQQAGGAQAVSIAYGSQSATVTDSLGRVDTYAFTGPSSYSPRVTGVTTNTGQSTSYTVPSGASDPQRRVTQSTDANGNITTNTYDSDHLTSKTEASGTGQARTTSYQYLATTTALPTLVTEALKTTSYTYAPGTNLVQTKTVTDPATSTSRTWSYTYDSYGRVLTTKGPRTDLNSTTTYTYYTCTTGAQCGQLQTLTDAVGKVTTYNTYNAFGQPLTITDPNGVLTTLTYDTRQRLTSRQVATETTTFTYYPTGLMQTVTLPDASTLTYTYDGAHRLVGLQDGLGNKTTYTLDGMGNRKAESTTDPTNVLSTTRSRVYNSLNELAQTIGAAGTTAVTTNFGYDNDGNQTSVSAPLSRNSSSTFDALNRLATQTDPTSGVTTFSYDANDNLTSVKDPNSLTTSYQYNGLGDLVKLTSPATGVTTNTYDSAGNLSTALDARGFTTTYTYDAANRVTQAAYGDQTINFTYDAGTYGKGRLTGASDANHTLAWQYDALGRVTSKSQSVGGITRAVGYTYASGDLTGITTPSGQSVIFSFSNHQIVGIAVNGTTLLSNVKYEPFGPVRGWSWGNGTAETRLHDTDGNPSQITAVESTAYTLDNAFRITGISNASNPTLSWTYGYDLSDRLTSATGASALSWTYDADGNRLTQGAGGASAYTTTYMVPSFNHRGRMVQVTATGPGTISYVYNALGQRIEKGTATGATLFWYDEAGHLLGEYDGSGNLIEETVWMRNLPVATLRPNGAGVTIYYVHADHLGTPKMVTRATDSAIMWRWDADPFGTAVPNQNPASLGTFVYNLRFPGQYYDVETGLSYNYARDYDPTVGRYVESDPIGLAGGSYSTYAFVRSSPSMGRDRFGLAEEPEEDEKDWIEEAIQDVLNVEANRLVDEIREYDPSYSEAFPPGYQRSATDIARLKDQLKQLQEQSECHNTLQETIDRVEAGIGFPHRNDGAIFRNNEGLLPAEPDGYYREYVVPTAGVYGPGAQRLVVGSNGEMYYTTDHYQSFQRVK